MSPGGEYSVMRTMLMATKIFISLMDGWGGGGGIALSNDQCARQAPGRDITTV